jgi:hypothetical protein
MCLKFSWLRQNKVLDWIIKSGFGVQSLITPKGGIFGMRFWRHSLGKIKYAIALVVYFHINNQWILGKK